MRPSILGLALLVVAAAASAAQEAPPAPGPAKERARPPAAAPVKRLALKGGTVLTVAGEPLAPGVVLIEGRKIAAVGRDVVIPAGTEVLDVTGKLVYPGLIDAGSILGLAASEVSVATGGLDLRDGLDPYDPALPRVLACGVTAAFVAPRLHRPRTGTIGAVIKVRPQAPPQAFILKEPAAVRAAVGVSSGTTSDTITRWRDARALDKTLAGIKSYIEAKKKYHESLARWRQDLAAWRQKVGVPGEKKETAKKKPAAKKAARTDAGGKKKAAPGSKRSGGKKAARKKKVPRRPKRPRKPRLDPVKEALQAVLEKRLPLRVEAHRVEDIRRALALAGKYDLRLVLEGATEGGALAREIKAAGAAVVAGPLVLFDPRRLEYEHFDPSTVATLKRAGVCVALASAAGEGLASRFMGFVAGSVAGHGLTRDEALRAVTLDAARVLGVEDRLGSIEKGKDADLVVADRHPTEIGCRIAAVLIDGEVVYRAK